MRKPVTIGSVRCAEDVPCVVVAEIGINHGGSYQEARKLVQSAAKTGVKVIKFQCHIAEEEMSEAAKKVVPVHTSKDIYSIMKDCELTEKEERDLMKEVIDYGIEYLNTPFSRAAAERLESMGVKCYKIGSGECNNLPLLEHIAKFKKPMIVSTGMNSLESIKKTVELLDQYDAEYMLLHTTNIYPTPPDLVRIDAINKFKKEFRHINIGLSDHTINNNACISAIALGATLVERHYTDTMTRIGPDISCSMDEHTCMKLVEASNEIFEMRGESIEPVREEIETSKFAFASVVAISEIKKGEVFSKKNIWTKRPGGGEIMASKYEICLGKISQKDYSYGEYIEAKELC